MYKSGDLRTDKKSRVWLFSETKGWVAVRDTNGHHSTNQLIIPFEHGTPEETNDGNRIATIEQHMDNLTSLMEDAYEAMNNIIDKLNDITETRR